MTIPIADSMALSVPSSGWFLILKTALNTCLHRELKFTNSIEKFRPDFDSEF